ncbi:hypothetical protein LWI28_002880 [Acer negundo]|uniref:NET domain-containing protein n=1 Tax=Acer negundo TaxID=4023 RepID=A0AAD5NRD0_ACENE|nr:hypothetical protein LWI28_002880 [Acer negundo]
MEYSFLKRACRHRKNPSFFFSAPNRVARCTTTYGHLSDHCFAFFVMSKASKSVLGSTSPGEVGPDYFGYYACEIAELLSQDEDSVPFTSQTSELYRRKRGKDTTENGCNGDSLFNNSIGTRLSDSKLERLKSLLRQGVFDLTPEVDEMLDPVVATCQLQTQLRNKKCFSSDAGAVEVDAAVPRKKVKTSSSSSSTNIDRDAGPLKSGSCREGLVSNRIDSESVDANVLGKEISNGKNNCVQCHTKETSLLKCGSAEPKDLCDACRITIRTETDFHSGSNINADKENGEVDEDLQFLLENDSALVEETMKKYSDELSARLGHMELQLEKLLDEVVSKCRPMTRTEKRELRRLIQKLPPNNLGRVVEILQHNNMAETRSASELLVDLEKEDNVTLWRLYYYVKAVEKARELLV